MKDSEGWVVSRFLVKKFGVETALFVAEMQRQERVKEVNGKGYFHVTQREIFLQTKLTGRKQKKIVDTLTWAGLLDTIHRRTKNGILAAYRLLEPMSKCVAALKDNNIYNTPTISLSSSSNEEESNLIIGGGNFRFRPRSKLVPKSFTRKALKARALSQKTKFPTVSYARPCGSRLLEKASKAALEVIGYWNTHSRGSISEMRDSKRMMKAVWFLDEKVLHLYSVADVTRAISNYGFLRAENGRRSKVRIKRMPLLHFLLGNPAVGRESLAARLIEPGAERKYIKKQYTTVEDELTIKLLVAIKKLWRDEKLKGEEVMYSAREELQFIDTAKRLRTYMGRGMLKVYKPEYTYGQYAVVLFDAVVDNWKRWRRVGLGTLRSDHTFNQVLPGYVADMYGRKEEEGYGRE